MTKKKNFLANTSLFSETKQKPEPETTEEKTAEIPEGYKLVPAESRSARLQILVTPKTKETLKTIASAEGVSMNEIINLALLQYVKEHKKET